MSFPPITPALAPAGAGDFFARREGRMPVADPRESTYRGEAATSVPLIERMKGGADV